MPIGAEGQRPIDCEAWYLWTKGPVQGHAGTIMSRACQPPNAVAVGASVTRWPSAASHSRSRDGHHSIRGQAVVDFALIAPIMIVIALAIIDLARIYTTMLTVESAAREAADFGTFGSQKWNGAVYSLVPDGTEAKMKHRACVASSTLPDYVGPDDACTNPTFSYQLSGDRGVIWAPYDPVLACDDATREPPCWLKVTLQYNFQLFVLFNCEFFGTSYGVPNTLTFERSSIFAMTDLDIP